MRRQSLDRFLPVQIGAFCWVWSDLFAVISTSAVIIDE